MPGIIIIPRQNGHCGITDIHLRMHEFFPSAGFAYGVFASKADYDKFNGPHQVPPIAKSGLFSAHPKDMVNRTRIGDLVLAVLMDGLTYGRGHDLVKFLLTATDLTDEEKAECRGVAEARSAILGASMDLAKGDPNYVFTVEPW